MSGRAPGSVTLLYLGLIGLTGCASPLSVGAPAGTPTGAVRPTANARITSTFSSADRPAVGWTERKLYASQILPDLTADVGLFTRASQTARRTRLAQLVDVCTTYGNRIGFQQNQLEGIPHPYLWFTPAGRLHHRVLGVFHFMLGAINACATAGDARSSSLARKAEADMATAAGRMVRITRYVKKIMASH
jgi:hypothetical protein